MTYKIFKKSALLSVAVISLSAKSLQSNDDFLYDALPTVLKGRISRFLSQEDNQNLTLVYKQAISIVSAQEPWKQLKANNIQADPSVSITNAWLGKLRLLDYHIAKELAAEAQTNLQTANNELVALSDMVRKEQKAQSQREEAIYKEDKVFETKDFERSPALVQLETDQFAYERKVTHLQSQLTQHTQAAAHFLELACDVGDGKAIEIKFGLLLAEDAQRARDFLDSMVARDYMGALRLKRNALRSGTQGYALNVEEAARINRLLIDKKSLEALWLSREYHLQGSEEWRAIVDESAKRGNKEARFEKLSCQLQGLNGYERNLEEAEKTLASLPSEASANLITLKSYTLMNNPKSEENDQAVCLINEWLVDKGSVDAKYLRIKGLLAGVWGYKKDLDKAKEEIDKFLPPNNDGYTLVYSLRNMEQNPVHGNNLPAESLRFCIDYLIEKGRQEGTYFKIKGLIEGIESGLGFEKNLNLAREMLSELRPGTEWIPSSILQEWRMNQHLVNLQEGIEFLEECLNQDQFKHLQRWNNKFQRHLLGEEGQEINYDNAREILAKYPRECEGEVYALRRQWLSDEQTPEKTKAVEFLGEWLLERNHSGMIYDLLSDNLKGSNGYEINHAKAKTILKSVGGKIHWLLAELKSSLESMEQTTDIIKSKEVLEEWLEEYGEDGIAAFKKAKKLAKQDPKAGRKFINKLYKRKFIEGSVLKMKGLSKGKFGFKKDVRAARNILNELMNENEAIGLRYKVKAVDKGKVGYKTNPKKARKLIEKEIEKNKPQTCFYNENVAHLKLTGVEKGKYGFKKNPKKARKLFEQFLQEGRLIPNIDEAYALAKGKWGFKRDREQALQIIDKAIEVGNPLAYLAKIEVLQKGKYGFKKNPKAASKLEQEFKKRFQQTSASTPVDMQVDMLTQDDQSESFLASIRTGEIAQAIEILSEGNNKVGSVPHLIEGFNELGNEHHADKLRSLIANRILALKPNPEVIERNFNHLSSGQAKTPISSLASAYRFARLLNYIPVDMR
jgi:hypothetical protein